MRAVVGFAAAVVLFLLFLRPDPVDAEPGGNADPIITMERTTCFGTCPAYSLAIYPDGTVVYEGKQFVGVTGRRQSKISPGQVQELIQAFLSVDYFSLEDSYRTRKNPDGTVTMITDLPTTYTSFIFGGKRKSVENYAFAPETLDFLEFKVDRIVNTHQWLHPRDDLKERSVVRSDIYARIKPGLTELMIAAGKGDTAAMNRELNLGADVNAGDETGWNALMVASVMLRTDAVNALLRAGARVNDQDSNEDTALIGAASAWQYYAEDREAQVTTLKLLLLAGAQADTRNARGQTALMWAARSGNLNAVAMLLDSGASIHVKDNSGKGVVEHAREAERQMKGHWNEELYEGVTAFLEREVVVRR